MSEVIHYRITAWRTVPIRSELTRLVRCTRQDSTGYVSKWRIEILDFPMDGILDTTYVHELNRNKVLGRRVCSKIWCSLCLGSEIEWDADWELISTSEAIKMLIEEKK